MHFIDYLILCVVIQKIDVSLKYNNNNKKMNAFTQILEKAASKLEFNFSVCQSDKSEAAYLLIEAYTNSDLNDIYSCFGVRLANHEAMTANSKNYELQIDCGFNFDYADNIFSTTRGIDEDGDFYEFASEDESIFKSEEEIINYMSNCLAVKLKNKI